MNRETDSQGQEVQEEVLANEQVRFSVKRKPNCVIEYDVEVLESLATEAYKKALRVVGKNVLIPGFRKGKAPSEIVAKRYPQDLDKCWQEEIANNAYQQCSQITSIPLAQNDTRVTFQMHKHSFDGAKLSLTFETQPAVPDIDPSSCVLKSVERPEVSPEKVKETIRQSQFFFATWKVIEGRAVQEGDFVLLNVDIIEEVPAKHLFKNTRFEVTDRTMAQWMKQLILGKQTGDAVEGISIPDSDLTEEQKAKYPPKRMRVTILKIEEASLPPLNDSFAKQLGVESASLLYEEVEKILNKKADDHVRELLREQVADFLSSFYFELPVSIVNKEAEFRVKQSFGDQETRQKWEQSTDHQRREMVNSIRAQAEKAVRIFYLCRKVEAERHVHVSLKDVESPFSTSLESFLFPSTPIHDPKQPDVKLAESYSKILLEKVEDWIIEKATSSA